MSEKTEQQEPHDLTIGQRTFRVTNLSSDCEFEILVGDDGDLHLICACSARAYALTVAEAKTLTTDILQALEQMRITLPVP
jgi:hypothetical protein